MGASTSDTERQAMDRNTAAIAPSRAELREVPEGTDLIEWYYEQGWSDGFPLVPPTPAKIAAVVDALAGTPPSPC